MMLGKGGRQPMKRTTSMTEFTLDLNNLEEPHPLNHNPFGGEFNHHHHHQQFLAAGVSPRNQRRNSVDFVQMTTPDFLRSCSLCKRRLVPGRDIYMYRGDSAFCSSECRQQQIKQDERKEKCSVVMSKKATSSSSPSKVPGAQVGNMNGETIAAV